MSGGHFDYKQYNISIIADEVEQLILTNGKDKEEPHGGWRSWEETKYPEYAPDIIDEFKNGLYILRKAHIYAQRIDWLVSCDDGEDSFRKRLKEELDELDKKFK